MVFFIHYRVSTSEEYEDSISGPTIHPGAQNINVRNQFKLHSTEYTDELIIICILQRKAYGQFINGAGVIGQQFIPYGTGNAPICDVLHSRNFTNAALLIGPQSRESENPTTSGASALRSNQEPVVACSSSSLIESTPSQPTRTRRKPAPDKFLPSSVKRIKFNKVP